MNALARFAEWIADAPRDWAEPCMKIAVGAFADTTACMIAGSDDASTLAVARSVADNCGPATAVTGGGTFLAPSAALINGTAAHALDFDDVLEGANTHASAVLVPAILALGEERRSTGFDCLDGYLVGLEVMACLGWSMDITHYRRGWHATSTIGTVAAAAAAARLMALPRDQTMHALSISVSMASGTKCQFGTSAKPFHAGMAAMNGLLAARLAGAGLAGSPDCLDGEWGVHALYGCNPDKPFAASAASLGADSASVLASLTQKPYPCCFSNHQAIQCILELQSRGGWSIGDVEEIRVALPAAYSANLMYRDPKNPREAQFCLEYCVATAALTGGISIEDLDPAMLDDRERRQVMARIVRAPYPEAEGPGDGSLPVTVVLRLLDRSHLLATRIGADTIDADAIAAKFALCTDRMLGADAAAGLHAGISQLQGLPDIRTLTRLIAPSKTKSLKRAS